MRLRRRNAVPASQLDAVLSLVPDPPPDPCEEVWQLAEKRAHDIANLTAECARLRLRCATLAEHLEHAVKERDELRKGGAS